MIDMIDYYAVNQWERQNRGDNHAEVERMKRALAAMIENALTDCQRQYLMSYYYEKNTMTEIAKRYGVDKSTVSRVIIRGTARIKRYVPIIVGDTTSESMTVTEECGTQRRYDHWIDSVFENPKEWAVVERGMALLTEKQRHYLTLYYEDGLSMTEIAVHCGIDKSTVSRGITRAVKALKKSVLFSGVGPGGTSYDEC